MGKEKVSKEGREEGKKGRGKENKELATQFICNVNNQPGKRI